VQYKDQQHCLLDKTAALSIDVLQGGFFYLLKVCKVLRVSDSDETVSPPNPPPFSSPKKQFDSISVLDPFWGRTRAPSLTDGSQFNWRHPTRHVCCRLAWMSPTTVGPPTSMRSPSWMARRPPTAQENTPPTEWILRCALYHLLTGVLNTPGIVVQCGRLVCSRLIRKAAMQEDLQMMVSPRGRVLRLGCGTGGGSES